jgi:hypothetical protein
MSDQQARRRAYRPDVRINLSNKGQSEYEGDFQVTKVSFRNGVQLMLENENVRTDKRASHATVTLHPRMADKIVAMVVRHLHKLEAERSLKGWTR